MNSKSTISPEVNLASNRISGFEALIRWNHPERGMVGPNAFIPLAEEIGLIVPIGEWVIGHACAVAARWPRVFLCRRQCFAHSIPQRRTDASHRWRARSGQDCVHPASRSKLPRPALLQDKDATRAILHRLRALGVRIALDDFGTGYSSLSSLQCFPFDKIKIDRSFVRDITENAGSRNIVRALAALAKGMGAKTTAEGVETKEQLDSVVFEGCSEMQGFLFSRPLPTEWNRAVVPLEAQTARDC